LAALLDDVLLVLLGDADQLPSIAAGAVFRDLGPLSVRLGRGFRADVSRPEGKQLALLATAVRAGHVENAVGLCLSHSGPDQLVWQGVEHLAPEQRDELLRTYHRRMFGDAGVAALVAHVYQEVHGGFAEEETRRLDALALHLARARILAVTRQGSAGVDDCNSFLHTLSGGGPGLLPGEPVLMLRNDYERELWNGDQGMAVRVRQSGKPAAVAVAFRSREGWRTVDARAMASALGLGFALSVHKAQGSEFDEVLLLLPDFACPLLTRELLYTAISRARKSVVLCGALARFSAGIATGETRNSGLAERMAAATAIS
jgi:exodeoxyribonuclease V alpha subunit